MDESLLSKLERTYLYITAGEPVLESINDVFPRFKYVVIATLILILSILNASCAYISSTDTYADGRKIEISAWEIGRTEALANLSDVTTKDGRSVAINGVTSDVNVKALESSGKSLGSIIGTALKAYTGNPL